MKQFLLASILIALPVAAFTGFEMKFGATPVAAAGAASLGDLSKLKVIIAENIVGLVKCRQSLHETGALFRPFQTSSRQRSRRGRWKLPLDLEGPSLKRASFRVSGHGRR